MSVTEELRRMLDERGVKWWEDAFSSKHRTVFDGKNGVRYCVYQLGGSLFISSILPVTPEQAIVATLGLSNCSNSERTGTCENVGYYIDPTRLKCSACGYNGWTKYAADGNDKVPNYCPNCGRRVVEQ